MSHKTQELEYDLFTMNYFEEELEQEQEQKATSQTVEFFAKPAAYKNYAELKALASKREKERIALIKNAPVGSILFGYSPAKVFGLNEKNELLVKRLKLKDTGEKVPETGKVIFKMDVYDNDIPTVMDQYNIDRVQGMEIEGEEYFFSTNYFEPITLLSGADFKERVNALSEHDVMEMVIYAVYMSEPSRKRVRNGERINPAEFKRHTSSNYFHPTNKYFEASIVTDKCYKDNVWRVRVGFLGVDLEIPLDEMDKKYNQFIQNIHRKLVQLNGTLSDLTNSELMAWYKCGGYDVKWDITTNEWTIKQALSKKKMYVDRALLEDFEQLELTYKKFVTTISPKRSIKNITRTFDKKETFAEKYNQPVELKAFTIPEGASIELRYKYQEIIPHSRYAVKKDDGKYVELIPIGNGGVVLTDTPIVQFPRKEIQYIGMNDEKGHHFGFFAPYAIPVDTEPTVLGLKAEVEQYTKNLSTLELKQALTLDYIMGKSEVFAAMEEKDYELAESLIAKTGTGGSSGNRVNGMWFRYENNKISYSSSWTVVKGKDIELTTKQAFDIFFDMYSATLKTPVDQLTLFELELKYKLEYQVAFKTEGIRGHFKLDGKNVHTTKYNLLNLEETVTALGLK